MSKDFKNFCVEKGITYHCTVPRTPQLNGVAERMNRTIIEKARAMLSGAGLDKSFWGEAVLTATFLINIIPTKALDSSKTPFEMWHIKKPQLKYLKVFGSTVYIHNKTAKDKFDPKSVKAVLVGYGPNGYKVWEAETGKFHLVRDVIVDEINFLVSRPRGGGIQNELAGKTDEVISSGQKSQLSDCKTDDVISSGQKSEEIIINAEVNKNNDIISDIQSEQVNTKIPTINDPVEKQTKSRRSDRIKALPRINYNENENMYNNIDNYFLSAHLIENDIPSSFNEIQNRADKLEWEKAINDELKSHKENKTWTLVERPKHTNIIDSKWVFVIKTDECGKPIKYKARLVVRGFNQEFLVDYNETFAPVARISSFRFLLAFSIQNNLLVHHLDVKTAFLNGELEEQIFMEVPQGVASKSTQVCRLNKAIYGLKQAARCWFQLFEKSLLEIGFISNAADRCTYILNKGNVMKNIYIILYVDDLVIATADIKTMNSLKNYLRSKFQMTDLNDIKYFIGMRITRTNDKITLDQNKYLQTVLQKFNMQDCKPQKTPIETKINYVALNSDEHFDAPCRNLLGCIMYAMVCTRPDLSLSVNLLSRFSNKNNKELWIYLKRILRYKKGTLNFKLTYIKSEHKEFLCGYVDSDWGGNELNRRSTTGYLFKLFESSTICWNTKKQNSVAASSTEAEYMALYEAVKEALWLRSFILSFKIHLSGPIIIFEDNHGCINIANNPVHHKRTKHIDIKYHFSREQIQNKIVNLKFIPTGHQIADMLTKPLSQQKFVELRIQMNLLDN